MNAAVGNCTVELALRAVIVHDAARADDMVQVVATIYVQIGGTEHQVGRAGGVTDPQHAHDIDTELRHHCAALGIKVEPA